MASYLGRHAELYDVIYADKPYKDEARFIHSCLQRYAEGPVRRVLELACGTGTHAVELSRLGYEIHAVDNSADMLACAQRKATAQGAMVTFYEQDMRELDLPDPPFDAAYSLFDSIGYALTNEGVEKVLRGVHRNLLRGGLFIFEFWHAPAMLRHYRPVGVRRWPLPDGELIRIAETELHHAEQCAAVRYSLFELLADGRYTEIRETHRNRYFLVQEMSSWLATTGFRPERWFAGFSETGALDDHCWHVLCVARRLAES